MADNPLAKAYMHWSKAALANEFKLDDKTVANLLSGVKPCGEYRGNPVYMVRDASIPLVKHIVGHFTHKKGDDFDPDELNPKERKDWFDSELKRIQHDKVCGELIPSDQIANADAEKNKKIALALDTMADVLERDVGLNADQVQAVNRIVDAARNDLFKSLTDG